MHQGAIIYNIASVEIWNEALTQESNGIWQANMSNMILDWSVIGI